MHRVLNTIIAGFAIGTFLWLIGLDDIGEWQWWVGAVSLNTAFAVFRTDKPGRAALKAKAGGG